MKPETLFISDLHLSAARPTEVQCFLRFIRERAAAAAVLYVLGDLFDAYIGDDDGAFPNRDVKAALKRLVQNGTVVYFQHGNRDFLVGENFCRDTGVRLLDDYAVVDLYGTATLVTHGDLLCSDDEQYQNARRRVRTADWKRRALAKPLFARRLYARWYRLRSQWDKRGKTTEIMDVNPETVVDTLRRFAVTRLVHGHTHRPAVHDVLIDGRPAQRFVLAEWHGKGQVLVCDSQGWAFETVS